MSSAKEVAAFKLYGSAFYRQDIRGRNLAQWLAETRHVSVGFRISLPLTDYMARLYGGTFFFCDDWLQVRAYYEAPASAPVEWGGFRVTSDRFSRY